MNWFKSIENKQQFSFICFDIEEFYPSISQDLLNKALDFASNYDNITTEERNIIIHAKNSILIHKHIPWQKKGNTTFDVTMGSYDGAETCELVGSFLLSQLQDLNINDISENMLGYLSADIICFEKRTVFRERSSRKTVSFEEQIMSKDKYPSIFSQPN